MSIKQKKGFFKQVKKVFPKTGIQRDEYNDAGFDDPKLVYRYQGNSSTPRTSNDRREDPFNLQSALKPMNSGRIDIFNTTNKKPIDIFNTETRKSNGDFYSETKPKVTPKRNLKLAETGEDTGALTLSKVLFDGQEVVFYLGR